MRGSCGQTSRRQRAGDLEALSFFAKGNDCADSFMAGYEGKCDMPIRYRAWRGRNDIFRSG